MKIFFNPTVRNVSIALAIVQFLAMIFTPGLRWSSDPKETGFWWAAFDVILSTLVINWFFVLVFTKKKSKN
jgi:hypothetical protein